LTPLNYPASGIKIYAVAAIDSRMTRECSTNYGRKWGNGASFFFIRCIPPAWFRVKSERRIKAARDKSSRSQSRMS